MVAKKIVAKPKAAPKPEVKEKAAPKEKPFLRCGDCDKKWPVGTTHCDCGYEL